MILTYVCFGYLVGLQNLCIWCHIKFSSLMSVHIYLVELLEPSL